MRHWKHLQRAIALGGFAAMVFATVRLWDGVRPDWAWHAFILWCVIVPYWHFLEYRFLAPKGDVERRRFLDLQSLSRAVWLGGAMVLAVVLLR